MSTPYRQAENRVRVFHTQNRIDNSKANEYLRQLNNTFGELAADTILAIFGRGSWSPGDREFAFILDNMNFAANSLSTSNESLMSDSYNNKARQITETLRHYNEAKRLLRNRDYTHARENINQAEDLKRDRNLPTDMIRDLGSVREKIANAHLEAVSRRVDEFLNNQNLVWMSDDEYQRMEDAMNPVIRGYSNNSTLYGSYYNGRTLNELKQHLSNKQREIREQRQRRSSY